MKNYCIVCAVNNQNEVDALKKIRNILNINSAKFLIIPCNGYFPDKSDDEIIAYDHVLDEHVYFFNMITLSNKYKDIFDVFIFINCNAMLDDPSINSLRNFIASEEFDAVCLGNEIDYSNDSIDKVKECYPILVLKNKIIGNNVFHAFVSSYLFVKNLPIETNIQFITLEKFSPIILDIDSDFLISSTDNDKKCIAYGKGKLEDYQDERYDLFYDDYNMSPEDIPHFQWNTWDIDERFPFEDNSVDLLYFGKSINTAKDIVHVMNESFRILSKRGVLAVCPDLVEYGKSNNIFYNSYWTNETFLYFTSSENKSLKKFIDGQFIGDFIVTGHQLKILYAIK